MNIEHLSRSAFHHYNQTHLRLAEQQESLGEFIGLPFSLESIKKQIKLKQESFSKENRQILQTHFKNQYKDVHLSESIINNIELLGLENSFTITTGQQLTLFGGPAFFFYKIIQCISLARKLKKYILNTILYRYFGLHLKIMTRRKFRKPPFLINLFDGKIILKAQLVNFHWIIIFKT